MRRARRWSPTQVHHCPPVCAGLLLGGACDKVLTVDGSYPALCQNVFRDSIYSPTYHDTFGPIRGCNFKPRKALLLRFAEELPRHFDFATFQVVSLFDFFNGQLIWRDEQKVEDDISSPETADIQSLNVSQNNCGTFSRHCANEETSVFVCRKPHTIKETVVQIRKRRHAR